MESDTLFSCGMLLTWVFTEKICLKISSYHTAIWLHWFLIPLTGFMPKLSQFVSNGHRKKRGWLATEGDNGRAWPTLYQDFLFKFWTWYWLHSASWLVHKWRKHSKQSISSTLHGVKPMIFQVLIGRPTCKLWQTCGEESHTTMFKCDACPTML